jgi:membrane protein EpsK
MIALPIGLVCGFSQPLLRIWLGPAFEPLAPLLLLMCLPLCVNLAVLPLFNIQMATNHVRLPGILTCVMGLGSLGLALLLAGPVGWGMYGVAVAGAVMLTAKNLVFTPLYAAHTLGLSTGTFYREILPIVGTTIGLTGGGWWLADTFHLHTWIELAAAGVIIAVLFVAGSYRFLLTSEERNNVLSLTWPRGRFIAP